MPESDEMKDAKQEFIDKQKGLTIKLIT